MKLNGKVKNLYENFKKGNRRALSRIISMVENENTRIAPLMKEIYKNTGRAFRIGITGPPGAGKSTLVNCLALELKKKNLSLGIIAVDPTSPFTGGALLGDRIRMTNALTDSQIFMRSMASRGGIGGLAITTPQTADLMDAFGFDVILIETVGVGQLDLDVASTVDTTVVVLVPETGGNVQSLKAGLIEIADVFVVNKADRDGADLLRQELMDALELMPPKYSKWKIPVLKTVALKELGIVELADTLENHYQFLKDHKLLLANRVDQKKTKIINIMKHQISKDLWLNEKLEPFLETLANLCVKGRMDPFTAADAFLRRAEVTNVKTDNSYFHR